tara:strand:- start:13976 stop:14665 length:690 start_codon:yes stop_codon:yes gene_type:complete
MDAFFIKNIFALVWLVACWSGFSYYATLKEDQSLAGQIQFFRVRWGKQLLHRSSSRFTDVGILNHHQQIGVFFASTTMLIIAGLITLLGAEDDVLSYLKKIPSGGSSHQYWYLKVQTLLVLFIFIFFKYTWAIRHWNYSAILVGAAKEDPEKSVKYDKELSEQFSYIGKIAARHFTQGLRGYYYGLATLAWFINFWAFIAATTWITLVLYRREFHSKILHSLQNDDDDD